MNVNDTLGIGADPLSEITRATLRTDSGWIALAGLRSGDTQPRVALGEYFLLFGQGGGSAVDCGILRTGPGSVALQGALNVSGNILAPSAQIAPGALSFGDATRQMINLWSTSYGIGVQSGTTYLRTAQRFAVHVGGTHSDTASNPGPGGTLLLDARSDGTFRFQSHTVWHSGNLTPGGGANWPLSLLAWFVAIYSGGVWVLKAASGVTAVAVVASGTDYYQQVTFSPSLSSSDYIIEASRARHGSDTGNSMDAYLDRSTATTSSARLVLAGTGNAEMPNANEVLSVKFWKATL